MKDTRVTKRKTDHIQINLRKDVSSDLTSGLEHYHFLHNALPEINLKEIDTSTKFLSKTLKFPLLISSMTGGTEEGQKINHALELAAAHFGIAMGVGSQRAAIDNPGSMDTFRVRDIAPDILLFANLGAVQLNYGFTIDQCRKVVDSISADGLILHLNPLQEALQPEGETNFSGLFTKIELICKHLGKPVIVKEVGWGISEAVATQLMNAGVSAIDVAGAGGTSWSQVEMHRSDSKSFQRIAADFKSWGIPTSESIRLVRSGHPNLPIIASGGIRTGLDIAKCIALGANMCGIAGPLLRAASISDEELHTLIDEIKTELAITMFGVGAPNILTLQKVPVIFG
jgi:isopentenyl-diphosphate delta-isomerase